MKVNDAEFERQPRFLGIADRRRDAGIGYRHHYVGRNPGLDRQFGTDFLARLIDAASLDHAVGSREVDIFENTEPLRRRLERFDAADAGLVYHDDFTGLDVTNEFSTDDIERAGLRREDQAAVEAADLQGADAEPVAHPDHRLAGHHDQRIGAVDLRQGVDQTVHEGGHRAGGDQVDDNLAIHRRLEYAAAAHQFAAHRERVGEIAVVGDRQAAVLEIGENRLDVAQHGHALGRIADMADRVLAQEALDHPFVAENVADLAETAMGVKNRPVVTNDPRRLLPAMLQRVEPEGGVGGGVGMAVDAEYAAFFAQLVVVPRVGGHRVRHSIRDPLGFATPFRQPAAARSRSARLPRRGFR